MSPYENLPEIQWKETTKRLINDHPLSQDVLISTVLEAWDGILRTKIANELQIGIDIFPTPQILGNYLHELIPVLLEKKYPGQWTRDIEKNDKDLVCVTNPYYSVEIKTSSNANNIYGNASYGQEDSANASSKTKDGYYLAINFEKFVPSEKNFIPRIKKIRFGWLDHSDWHSQNAPSGQAATISPIVRDNKLLLLYDVNKGGKQNI
ncbi:ScaI family restriction endonuclease [Eshraghiella crossota]|jgi:hypothetical protein rflaF_16131|uniref:ScaI family restriction endonuclease n=1 Tax=Eshraghiella crossota TaxID=45851 RepID=UPI003AB436B6